MFRSLSLLLALVLVSEVAYSSSLPAVSDGDIIFQASKSTQSHAIQRATHSRYSHMGIVFVRDGKPFVLEASATVRYTPLEKWIARGQRSQYVVKRLRGGITTEQVLKLRHAARAFLGRPYDLTFEWSDARIYCSELVWKIYQNGLGVKIGELQRLRDFDLSDGAVRAKMMERYGAAIPMDELVISPAAMFDAKKLVVIASD